MKTWFYLGCGMFLTLIVTLGVYISFPAGYLHPAEVAFLTFVPAFGILLLVLMLGRTKKKTAHALTLSITIFVIYLILRILSTVIPIAIPAIIAVSLGIVACAFLTASELRLAFFGVLLAFVCQSLAMALFLIH